MFKNSLFLLLFLGGIEFYGHLNLQEAPLARLVAVYLFVSQITLCLPFPNDLPVYPKPFPFVLLLFLFCEIPTGVRVEVQRCSFGSMCVNQGISRLHQLVHKQRPVAVNRYILMCLHAVASDLVFSAVIVSAGLVRAATLDTRLAFPLGGARQRMLT